MSAKKRRVKQRVKRVERIGEQAGRLIRSGKLTLNFWNTIMAPAIWACFPRAERHPK